MIGSVRAITGVLAAAAIFAAAPAAQAAVGDLVVDGSTYSNPSGCLFLGPDAVRDIANNTDSVVTLFRDAQCVGDSTGVLAAGQSGSYTAKSAQIG